MKLRVLSVAFLLLAACGGTTTAKVSCVQDFWNGTIGTCFPEGWAALEGGALRERGLPADVTLAFQSHTPLSGQRPTVTVTSEPLKQPLESAAYSEASVNLVSTLPAYALVDLQTVDVDGQEVGLHIFTAQPMEQQPARRFYQVSAVSGDTGYTFTGSLPLSVPENLEDQVLLILKNATFEAPKEE